MNDSQLDRRNSLKIPMQLAAVLILCWLILILPKYIDNVGGSGMKMPQNIITWVVMLVLITITWIFNLRKVPFLINDTSILILVAVFLLTIPLFYTEASWHEAAFFRWGGLLIGVIFYISLLQLFESAKFREIIITAIILAAAIQALIALLQFLAPEWVPSWVNYPVSNKRPVGVFQQPNVLGSFIATGLALALRGFLFPSSSIWENFRSIKIAAINKLLLSVMLILAPMVLMLLQSRIGWLGSVAAVVCLAVLGWPSARKRTFQALSLIAFGVILAKIIELTGEIVDINHDDSNHARLEMMLTTLKMIAIHPLQGWGYGGFEYVYQHFRLENGLPVIESDVVRHPHNEILLWWLEGGLIGLAGITIIGFAGARVVWRAWLTDFPRNNPTPFTQPVTLSLACSLLPIALHSETEYPFMLSTAQWAIALCLFALLDKQVSRDKLLSSCSKLVTFTLNWLMPVLTALMSIAMLASLHANIALTRFEKQLLAFGTYADIASARRAMELDIVVNRERWQYDEQTWALMQFNQTRDRRLLEGYAQWANNYLKKRIDRNVYANYLAIAYYLKDTQTAQQLKYEAHIMFPDDPRFGSPTPATSR